MKILLDVGHLDSVGDYGAIGVVREYDRNKAVVDCCTQYFDFVRVPDNTGSLQNTINWINNNSNADDFLISIHANAGGGTGDEVYFYGGNIDSKNYAQKLLDFITKETGLKSRGVKPDTSTRFGRLGMVRDTKPWALLVECGFVDNSVDMSVSPQKYAWAIAQFVQSLGIKLKLKEDNMNELQNFKKQLLPFKHQEYRRENEQTVHMDIMASSAEFFVNDMGCSFDNVIVIPADWSDDIRVNVAERDNLRKQNTEQAMRIKELEEALYIANQAEKHFETDIKQYQDMLKETDNNLNEALYKLSQCAASKVPVKEVELKPELNTGDGIVANFIKFILDIIKRNK